MRPEVWPDPLYGHIRVAGWAAALISTPPFRRLAGISLSDVPGELLFGRPFPSRLDHTRGVYHLTRVARPRDRVLQVAALAHDLGHGPFGHVTEPLMRDWLGFDHEERSARTLAQVRAALPPAVARQLSWLDWDDAAQLVVGAGQDNRGALLNGRLDYDNLDNVGRFMQAAELGDDAYDGPQLARALRLTPALTVDMSRLRAREPVYLLSAAEPEGAAWQDARAKLYGFLHADHRNMAPHAMLRKAVEIAYDERVLPEGFLDMTDDAALRLLEISPAQGAAAVARLTRAGPTSRYICAVEADVPAAYVTFLPLHDWRSRLRWEAELAREAGLAPHELIAEIVVSSASRALPPLSPTGRPDSFTWMPAPLHAPRVLHIYVAPATPRDYVRRIAAAAERRLSVIGLASRLSTDSA